MGFDIIFINLGTIKTRITMKKLDISNTLVLGLILSFALTEPGHAQTYCVVPPSLNGPYTGITNVTLANLNYTSPGPEDSISYNDYTSVDTANLVQGDAYPVAITTVHTLLGVFSDYLNTRVWIDWNQDGDFEDANEEAAAWDSLLYGLFEATITVPANAAEGTTRMRVYEDMLIIDGHEWPHPCGYSVYPANPLGHYGECEDYTVMVSAPPAAGISRQQYSPDILTIYSNLDGSFVIGFELSKLADVSLELYSVLGQKLKTVISNEAMTGKHFRNVDKADLGKISSSLIFVRLKVNNDSYTEKVVVF